MSYKGSVSRIEKWSRFVLFLVMLVLAGFLSALGDKVLSDFNQWVKAPQEEAFQDKPALQKAAAAESAAGKQVEKAEEIKSAYQASLEKAERQYQSQKQSYADWLQARSAIGSSQEDSEVRLRAKTLDQFRQIRESWQMKIDEADAQLGQVQQTHRAAQAELQKLEQTASQKYYRAMERYGLKIFFIRLAFVLPILLLGLFLFVHWRRSRFWPLVWGYILFSLYGFFVGLVPYLPSFGGYIRLAIGVALSLFIGYYVVRQLNFYMAKKKAELEESTQERAGKIKDEIAYKAFLSHSCPSCEHDFLINKWYPKVGHAGEVRLLDEAPDHCAFCGLPLFGKCPKCGQRNFLHFPFCSACGAELLKIKK